MTDTAADLTRLAQGTQAHCIHVVSSLEAHKMEYERNQSNQYNDESVSQYPASSKRSENHMFPHGESVFVLSLFCIQPTTTFWE